MIKQSFLLTLCLATPFAWACTDTDNEFLPKNDLRFPESRNSQGLTKQEYNDAIDKVYKVYSPIVKKNGGELIINRLWSSDTVNAGTLKQGKKWIINMYGGFARHPLITSDGFMMVICHELGHHLAGAPRKFYSDTGTIWASTEGQSDYFANLKCLREVFKTDDNIKVVSGLDVPEIIRTECNLSFQKAEDAALCMRTSFAGIAVASISAHSAKLPYPVPELTDGNVVEVTANEHPKPQCRLDTYIQGSLCTVPTSESVSQIDEVKGTCHPLREFTRGLRPDCWFKHK